MRQAVQMGEGKVTAPATKETDERGTPGWILDLVTDALGEIEYDPCTTHENPTGARFYTALPDNGLEWAWEHRAKHFARCRKTMPTAGSLVSSDGAVQPFPGPSGRTTRRRTQCS